MELFFTTALLGSPNTLTQVGSEVLQVHGQVTASLLTESKEEWQKSITRDLQNPKAHFVLLRLTDTKQLVGFSHAGPNMNGLHNDDVDLWFERKRKEKLKGNILKFKIAEVGWTEILEEHRGKGGWRMMMDELDALLKASGYIYMTREVRESNDYANKVKARYGDRVEFEKFIPGFDHVGHQRYMRIRV